MKFFTECGNFLTDHLLAAVIWMILVNLALFALCGEDENRAAHRKPRYPFALQVGLALIGGAAGGMIGSMRYAKRKPQKRRGVLFLILALIQETLLIFSICRSERTLRQTLSGAGADFLAAFSWIHAALGWARTPVLLILGAMSLLSFAIFGIDKRKAVKSKGRRIPEAALITLTVLGGAPGSLLAMLIFRHKTRHAKFTVTVGVCLCLQLFLLVGVLLG